MVNYTPEHHLLQLHLAKGVDEVIEKLTGLLQRF